VPRRITTDYIGYRVETEDLIYILEYCYNPVVQHPWPGQHSRNRAPDVTLYGKTKIAIEGHDALSLPKMLSVANAFKISDHQCN
jgi:hypothetical protein